jgi:hypothetical protein
MENAMEINHLGQYGQHLSKGRLKRLCSSRDGVHLRPDKDTRRQDSLSKWID